MNYFYVYLAVGLFISLSSSNFIKAEFKGDLVRLGAFFWLIIFGPALFFAAISLRTVQVTLQYLRE